MIEAIRDNPESVCARIAEAFPLWKGKRAELSRRISFLSKQARKLKKPTLANHWGDYRNFFGGKIESWVSNYIRQKTDITGKGKINKKTNEPEKGEIELHKDDIERALGKDFISKETKEQLEDLSAILGRTYNEKTDNISNDVLETYRTELANARSLLNVAYQTEYADLDAYESEETDKQNNKDKRANTDLPHLFKDIKQLPEFVGEAKKKRFIAFMEAPRVLRMCLEKLSTFENARKKWQMRDFNSTERC